MDHHGTVAGRKLTPNQSAGGEFAAALCLVDWQEDDEPAGAFLEQLPRKERTDGPRWFQADISATSASSLMAASSHGPPPSNSTSPSIAIVC